jgi:hypothetical protein
MAFPPGSVVWAWSLLRGPVLVYTPRNESGVNAAPPGCPSAEAGRAVFSRSIQRAAVAGKDEMTTPLGLDRVSVELTNRCSKAWCG